MKRFIFCFAFVVSVAGQGTLVVPNGLENVEGNSTAGGFLGGSDGSRSQIVYNSSLFSPLPQEGAFITEIRFRMDSQFGSGFSGLADMEIRLSTTALPADGLFTDLARNVGADVTLVLPRSIVQLEGTKSPGTSPNSFSITIPLPNLFHYDPRRGNLLIDALVYGTGNVGSLDWQLSPDDGASTAVQPLSGSIAPTFSTIAPVAQFVFIPVPEMKPTCLILFGSLILIGLRRYVAA